MALARLAHKELRLSARARDATQNYSVHITEDFALRLAESGFTGPAEIAGTLKNAQTDTPVTGPVYLHDAKTGKRLATTTSGGDGRYRFTRLDQNRRYYVVSIDQDDQFDAVASGARYPCVPGS